jgi:alpha-1,4-galacturonosyltransferase
MIGFIVWCVKVPEVMYQVLEQPLDNDELKGRDDIPQTLEEFMDEVKNSIFDAKAFALKLREMVSYGLYLLFDVNTN